MHVCEGDGSGDSAGADGSAVAVESGPESGSEGVDPEVDPGEPGRVADWASLSGPGVADSAFADSEADGEAEGLGEDEVLSPPVSVRSSRGCADALGPEDEPSTSDASPAAAGFPGR